jgi:hypothetical protein
MSIGLYNIQTGGVYREPVFGHRDRYLPRRITVLLGTNVTIWRPASDVLVTSWTGTPNASNLYANINEEVLSNASYIQSPDVTSNTNPVVFALTNSIDTAGSYVVKVTAKKTDTAGQLKITLENDSSTSMGSSSWQTLTNSWVEYPIAVTTTGRATRVRVEIQNV